MVGCQGTKRDREVLVACEMFPLLFGMVSEHLTYLSGELSYQFLGSDPWQLRLGSVSDSKTSSQSFVASVCTYPMSLMVTQIQSLIPDSKPQNDMSLSTRHWSDDRPISRDLEIEMQAIEGVYKIHCQRTMHPTLVYLRKRGKCCYQTLRSYLAQAVHSQCCKPTARPHPMTCAMTIECVRRYRSLMLISQ